MAHAYDFADASDWPQGYAPRRHILRPVHGEWSDLMGDALELGVWEGETSPDLRVCTWVDVHGYGTRRKGTRCWRETQGENELCQYHQGHIARQARRRSRT